MSLKDVFISAVDTTFTVFADMVKTGRYITNQEGNGFDDDLASDEYTMDVIVNGLSQSDLRNSKFFAQIQPEDTVIMVKGKDIASNAIRVRNSDSFEIDFPSYTGSFNIIGHDTDPAEALFLLLLREK